MNAAGELQRPDLLGESASLLSLMWSGCDIIPLEDMRTRHLAHTKLHLEHDSVVRSRRPCARLSLLPRGRRLCACRAAQHQRPRPRDGTPPSRASSATSCTRFGGRGLVSGSSSRSGTSGLRRPPLWTPWVIISEWTGRTTGSSAWRADLEVALRPRDRGRTGGAGLLPGPCPQGRESCTFVPLYVQSEMVEVARASGSCQAARVGRQSRVEGGCGDEVSRRERSTGAQLSDVH